LTEKEGYYSEALCFARDQHALRLRRATEMN